MLAKLRPQVILLKTSLTALSPIWLTKGFPWTNLVYCNVTVPLLNTIWRTGVIGFIVQQIKRPLQWVVCLSHFNELPFRLLFQTLDGETTVPKSFSGRIDIQLPVVGFGSVDCEVPYIDPNILSKDQQYLLQSAAKLFEHLR